MKRVTAAVIRDGEKILVVRRAQGQAMAGFWEFPGGKVEPGETLEQCLTRELWEELSINASVGAIVATSRYHYPGGAIELIAMDAVIQGGSMALSVHDEARWLLPGQLSIVALAPADVPIANRLKELARAA